MVSFRRQSRERAAAQQTVSDLIDEIGSTLPPRAHVNVVSVAHTVADALGLPTDEKTQLLIDQAVAAAEEGVKAYAKIVQRAYVGQGFNVPSLELKMRSIQEDEPGVEDPATLRTGLESLKMPPPARVLLEAAVATADLPDDIRAALLAEPAPVEGEPRQPTPEDQKLGIGHEASILNQALHMPHEARLDYVAGWLEAIPSADKADGYPRAAAEVDAWLRENAATYHRVILFDGFTPGDAGPQATPTEAQPLAAVLPRLIQNSERAVRAFEALDPALGILKPEVSDKPPTDEELAVVDERGLGDEWRESPAAGTYTSVVAARDGAAAARRLNTALTGLHQRWQPAAAARSPRSGTKK